MPVATVITTKYNLRVQMFFFSYICDVPTCSYYFYHSRACHDDIIIVLIEGD